MNEQDFFSRMAPYARQASLVLGIPSSVILAQWANESAYGTSSKAKNANNYGGIKKGRGAAANVGEYEGHAKYPSISSFVDDYIRVMKLNYYNQVRAAGSPKETFIALGNSPYAETGYGRIQGQPGGWLEKLWEQWKLWTYDVGSNADQIPDVSHLPKDELMKYAAVGLAVVGIVGLMRS